MAFHKWAEMLPNGEGIRVSFRALTHFIISLWDPAKPSMASHVNVHGSQWVGEGADWSSALESSRCLRHSLYIFMSSSKLLRMPWTKSAYMLWETARSGNKMIAGIYFCSSLSMIWQIIRIDDLKFYLQMTQICFVPTQTSLTWWKELKRKF